MASRSPSNLRTVSRKEIVIAQASKSLECVCDLISTSSGYATKVCRGRAVRHANIAHTPTPCQIVTMITGVNPYATKVLAVALSYLQVGGRTPTVL